MKRLFFLLILFLWLAPACTSKREKALQLKETELNEKEQQLLLREKSVQAQEEELLARERLLDSTSNVNVADTLSVLHPSLPGIYNVNMRCTETSCPGSAVGDTKNEQWDLSFENNTVVVKAMSDKKIVRIYRGSYVGNSIELTAQTDNMTTTQAGNMTVRLQETNYGLEGLREIIRPENCRIIFTLDLKKL